MSNNAHVNDDEIEIHQLPEVSTLQAGMMVAVDSQPTGTKSFNLTTALEGKASASDFTTLENTVAEKANASDMTTALEGKVDAPSTTPAEGQVLTFDGSANTWANPPKGVYMLKYSEVTNLDDVDLDKATTIPTFILIDSKQTLVIGNGSSGTTITVNAGTIMRLEEVGVPDPDNAGKPKLLTFVSDYGNSATGGTYMTYGNYFVRLVVSKSMYGGVSKQFGVSADIWDSNLFRSQQIPVVKKYDNARGPAESIGNLNGDANSLIVSFEDAGSNKRRQLLPPAELASHDFSSDTTPEQIQFMGWGATSNRAGYKELITAKSNIEDDQIPLQTPTVSITKMNIGNPASLEEDQVVPLITTTVKDTSGTSSTIDGYLIPRIPSIQGEKVYLQYYWEGQKGHLDWAKIDAMSDLVLVTGETGAEKAANCQAIIDAGKLPIYNAAWKDNGVPYNQVLVYQCSDDNNFYFMGCYPTYFVNGTFKFRANTNDIQIGLWHFDKTSFSNGYTVRTIDDLLANSAPISSTTSSATIPNNRLTIIGSSYTNNQSTYTVQINSTGYATNAAFEINPNVNMTLTVERRTTAGTTTLKHSVAAGNQLEAGKYYQVTAVGNCWTLAEFEA